jgi:hypothetical protein
MLNGSSFRSGNDGGSEIAATRDPDQGPVSASTPEAAKSAFRALCGFLLAAPGFYRSVPVFQGPGAEQRMCIIRL